MLYRIIIFEDILYTGLQFLYGLSNRCAVDFFCLLKMKGSTPLAIVTSSLNNIQGVPKKRLPFEVKR